MSAFIVLALLLGWVIAIYRSRDKEPGPFEGTDD